MKLLDPDPLRVERVDDIAAVIRHTDQPRHPVPGTACRGDEVITVAGRNHPFELDGGLDLQTVRHRGVNQPLQQQTVTPLVRLAVLPVPIARCPSPTWL